MEQGSGVTYALGFTAAGVACSIRKSGGLDLAVVKCDIVATAAGLFTRNVVKGHSLQLARKNVRNGRAQLVVVNAGCANACLARRGEEDALRFALLAARRFGCAPEDVLPGSTGVIGFPLPMDKLAAGLGAASPARSGGEDAARAIMTTDTHPKQAQESFMLDGCEVRIGGMAKGSGMIHPNMATMISVLTTDAAISRAALKQALKAAADVSYNRISVDGDTSVCDKVLILASGRAGNPVIEADTPGYARFLEALSKVCTTLAKMLARDGEGATKLLEFRLVNAPDAATARTVLQSVVKSPLVKTMFFGEDANLGRIFTAMGYSGAQFDPNLVDIFLGGIQVCRSGAFTPFDEAAALAVLKEREITVTLDMHAGVVEDRMWTCDLTYDYIKINGAYRT